jgi:prepilin-type N-terminal cleavage/methylation domain-containing protein
MSRRLRMLLERLRDQRGFTLTELVTVMAVLTIVIGSLVSVFVAGLSAQSDAIDSLNAQSSARTAADKLRREVHCASAITSTGTAVTLTLPAACGSAASVEYRTQPVAANRFRLERAGVEIADFLTNGTVFSYTAPTTEELGRLQVDLPVNIEPGQTHTEWRLVDEVVLRNSQRVTS